MAHKCRTTSAHSMLLKHPDLPRCLIPGIDVTQVARATGGGISIAHTHMLSVHQASHPLLPYKAAQACHSHQTRPQQHRCTIQETPPGLTSQTQLAAAETNTAAAEPRTVAAEMKTAAAAESAMPLADPASCWCPAPTGCHCTSAAAAPNRMPQHPSACHSARAAAACCTTSASLCLRCSCRTWRHTGSPPSMYCKQHRTASQHVVPHAPKQISETS